MNSYLQQEICPYQRTSISKPLHNLGDSGSLLPDSDVDAVEFLLLVLPVVEALLVDDGVDGDGSLTRLSVTDDQFSLATANGHQGVHGLDPSLHGLPHGDAGDDARGLGTDTSPDNNDNVYSKGYAYIPYKK